MQRCAQAALYINLNPAKRFVKSPGLIVARHGQNNEVAPAFRKPESGSGRNEAATDLPAMIGLENIDRKDFTIGPLGCILRAPDHMKQIPRSVRLRGQHV